MGKVIKLDSTEAVDLAAETYGFHDDGSPLDVDKIHIDQFILGVVRTWWDRRKKVEGEDNVVYVDWQKREPAKNYWGELVRNQIWMMEIYQVGSNDLGYVEAPEFVEDFPTMQEYVEELCPAIIKHIAISYSSGMAADLERRLEEFKRDVYQVQNPKLKIVK